jgi:proteasome lid subunit RPN8/RPN11
MIVLPPPLLKAIVDAAEAAYPEECCGLLVGRTAPAGTIHVERVEASPNVVNDNPRRRFEIDPQVRFDLMRELGDDETRIVGLYHSHPGHAAQPSKHDLGMAWEPELVWLITAVHEGQAVLTTAHILDEEGRQFRQVGLRTDDWQPYPVRDTDADTGDTK